MRLEKKAEGLRENGAKLKKERTRGASVFAWTFGSCSALLLGGGMSLTMLVTDSLPAMIGGIALGIAGIALCALNYLFYRRLAAKKTEKLLPLEEENGEKLAVVCEQAHELAANGELL